MVPIGVSDQERVCEKSGNGDGIRDDLLRSTPTVVQPNVDPEAENYCEKSYIMHPDSMYEDDMAIFSMVRKRKTYGSYRPI